MRSGERILFEKGKLRRELLAARLPHEQRLTGALDLAGDLPVEVGRHAGDATGQDLAALGHEALEKIGILEVDQIDRDVDPAAGHRPVGTTESRTALWSLRRGHGVITWFPGGAYGASGTGCTSFSPDGLEYSGSFYCAWKYSATRACLRPWPPCTRE